MRAIADKHSYVLLLHRLSDRLFARNAPGWEAIMASTLSGT